MEEGVVAGAMRGKRKVSDESSDDRENEQIKRLRGTFESLADEYTCPITQELPLDPVTAEDGRVYERSAIEAWLGERRLEGQAAKSPMTNEPMGQRLLPAIQVRNSIKAMVESGSLVGHKADAWKQRMEDKEEVEAMKRRAYAGDESEAFWLGIFYQRGMRGLVQNYERAFMWYKRSADLGGSQAMANLGFFYQHGLGVSRNGGRALFYSTRAADAGSELACYMLGSFFANGLNGLDKDEAEATKWFKRMPKCDKLDCPDPIKEEASRWLRERLRKTCSGDLQ